MLSKEPKKTNINFQQTPKIKEKTHPLKIHNLKNDKKNKQKIPPVGLTKAPLVILPTFSQLTQL